MIQIRMPAADHVTDDKERSIQCDQVGMRSVRLNVIDRYERFVPSNAQRFRRSHPTSSDRANQARPPPRLPPNREPHQYRCPRSRRKRSAQCAPDALARQLRHNALKTLVHLLLTRTNEASTLRSRSITAAASRRKSSIVRMHSAIFPASLS